MYTCIHGHITAQCDYLQLLVVCCTYGRKKTNMQITQTHISSNTVLILKGSMINDDTLVEYSAYNILH